MELDRHILGGREMHHSSNDVFFLSLLTSYHLVGDQSYSLLHWTGFFHGIIKQVAIWRTAFPSGIKDHIIAWVVAWKTQGKVSNGLQQQCCI